MTAQTVSKKKNQPLKCSQEVRNIPLERFRLPSDGRKWKQVARSRSALLCRLATYANADGTFVRDGRNYSPSLKTLLNHVAKASYFRITDALKALGLLSWTRERHHERRIYTILLPEQVSRWQKDSSETGLTSNADDPEQVSDSPEQVSHSQITGLTSVNHPSLPSLPSKQRAEKDQSPAAPPAPSDSRPMAADRENAKKMVLEIKKAALRVNEKAFFSSKSDRELATIVTDNPILTREDWQTAVQSQVQNMDDFQLKNCGSNLAAMLLPVIEVRVEQIEADIRRQQDIERSIAAGRAAHAEEEREFQQRVQKEEETAKRIEENPAMLFGG